MKHMTLRRLVALTAIIGATGCLAIVASAQGPGGPGGPPGQGRPGGFGGPGGGRGGRGGGRPITAASLPVETLDAMVKLNAGQKTKIAQIHDTYTKSMTAMRPAPGQRPDPSVFQKFGALSTQANQSIDAVLTTGQKTKLAAGIKELATYRLAGIPFGLYGQIQLTSAQKTSLAQIQQTVSGPQVTRDARTAARTQAAALLTPAQKALVDKYEKDHPTPRGGFGGPGGGGGRGGFGGPGGPGGPGAPGRPGAQ
jgi:hypothetical protein